MSLRAAVKVFLLPFFPLFWPLLWHWELIFVVLLPLYLKEGRAIFHVCRWLC